MITLTLRSLGFTDNTFSEVIVVTLGRDGSPNPAPMGVKLRGDKLVMWVYKDTKTYMNIVDRGECTVNVVYDAEPFYASIFERDRLSYADSERISTPRLGGALATVEALATVVGGGDPAEVLLTPVAIEVAGARLKPFNRAEPAIIEALVHYTKIGPFMRMGRVGEAVNSYLAIKHCRRTVLHSTENPALRLMITRIEEEARGLILGSL